MERYSSEIKMPIEMMSTTRKHSKIINAFVRGISGVDYNSIDIVTSDCALVYCGKRNNLETVKLVDIDKLTNIEYFKEVDIYLFSYVEPDFMMFYKNKFIENERGTRTAGFPDLVIEVWSDGNEDDEKIFKKFLYSTSPLTEHWYVRQDSNDVECYIGKTSLKVQSLKNVLRMQNGIEFDLRDMAI